METQAKLQLISNKPPVRHSHRLPVCETCKAPIEESTFRFLIVNDEDLKEEQLSFHYFFPCWDVNYVCDSLGTRKILQAGFDCDESILENPKSVNNLKQNCDLWDV